MKAPYPLSKEQAIINDLHCVMIASWIPKDLLYLTGPERFTIGVADEHLC